MMEENARVVDVQDGFVWVETERKNTCGACSLNKGCGSAVLAKVLGVRRTRIRALNALSAEVGDEVVLGLAEAVGRLLRLAPGETPTVLFALAGLAAGFYGVRHFTRRINNDPRYQPVVLRRAWTH